MKPMRARPTRPLRRRLRGEGGATAVEFALVLAVLIPFVFALFEIGRALHMRNALDYLADRAARSVMIHIAQDGAAPDQATLLAEARERVVGIPPDAIMLVLRDANGEIEVRISHQASLIMPFFPAPVREMMLSARRTVSRD